MAAELSVIQMLGLAFTAFGASVGGYLGQRRTNRELRRLVNESGQQIRDRIDALEIEKWGNARKWHLTAPSPGESDG